MGGGGGGGGEGSGGGGGAGKGWGAISGSGGGAWEAQAASAVARANARKCLIRALLDMSGSLIGPPLRASGYRRGASSCIDTPAVRATASAQDRKSTRLNSSH